MRFFGKLVELSAALALFILVIMTIAAVFMRYFVGQPIQWTEEMSGLLMIWVVMLGGVVAERDRAHLTIPFVVDCLAGCRAVHRIAGLYGLAGLSTGGNGAVQGHANLKSVLVLD